MLLARDLIFSAISLEVSIAVQDSEGLIFWLMQHGKNLEVLGPENVRNRLVSTLKETLRLYTWK
jgi:predicted DNA-binding transcriptional regulator YafY